MGQIKNEKKIKKIILGISIAIIIILIILIFYLIYGKDLNKEEDHLESKNKESENIVIDEQKIDDYLQPFLRGYTNYSIEDITEKQRFSHLISMIMVDNKQELVIDDELFLVSSLKEYAKKYYNIDDYNPPLNIEGYTYDSAKKGFILINDNYLNNNNSYTLDGIQKFGTSIIVIYLKNSSSINFDTYEVMLSYENGEYLITGIEKIV